LFEQQNSRTTEEYNNKNNARGRQTLISFEVEKVYRDLLGVGRDAYFDLFAAKGRTKSVCVCERERERERASERARERERESWWRTLISLRSSAESMSSSQSNTIATPENVSPSW
jgi:hypothetical protein